MAFPKRSLPWLFTNEALGGLKPSPASRLRGALPHLLCSYAHFILKCARGALGDINGFNTAKKSAVYSINMQLNLQDEKDKYREFKRQRFF
jgi:hypothetical protein